MSIQLAPPDFQCLVSIVQKLPDFRTETGRWRLIDGALEGSPRADAIRGQLDLSGALLGAAVGAVKTMADFGQVVYGKEALGIFLNYLLQNLMGEGEAPTFIQDLFSRYSLDVPASSKPLDNWRGREDSPDVKEKIIGENTLRDVRILELALDAAQAVVLLQTRLTDGKGHAGTGFMVASDLLMTNHHVISGEFEASATECLFNYQLDLEGRECLTQRARVKLGGLFYTNALLDFTVMHLEHVPEFGAPLRFRPAVAEVGSRAAIIQHPGGHLKKISLQNNYVVYADRQTVQYTTSTLPGSSGSPVFDDEFKVFAIHHSGGQLVEPKSGREVLRNAGSSMVAVLDDLKAKAPDIYKRLVK